MARDSETRVRENTRGRPARATVEEIGRKSKHEGREAEASGVPDKVGDKIGILGFAHSGREGGYGTHIHIYIYTYISIYNYININKFSLRSGINGRSVQEDSCRKTYLVGWFGLLFHQLIAVVCAAVGALAQMYLLTTKI